MTVRVPERNHASEPVETLGVKTGQESLVARFSRFFPAVLATGLPIVFIPRATDSYILPRASIVVVGACVGVGLALAGGAVGRLGAMRWPLAAAAAAAVLAFVFSTNWPLSLAGSYLRYESLPMRLSYLGLFASAVWLLRGQESRDWLVGGFVFSTCVSCIEALQQWYIHIGFRPDGNLGNANLVAALVAMALPLALQRVLRRDEYLLAWAAAIVILGAGWWVTTSRSGGIAILAGCLTLAVFMTRGRLAIGTAAVSVGVAAAGIVAMLASPLRLLNNDPPELRLHLWADSLRMIAARPVTGWGEDATGLSFGHFLSQDYASLVTFDRIHSGPLDIAAMQGLIGLVALSWVLAVLGVAAWRRRHNDGVAGLAAAAVGYSVWVLFNFDWAPVTGVFWLLAGTLWAAAFPPPLPASAREGRFLWRPALAVPLVGIAVVFGVLPVLADVWYLKGRADIAVRLDPLQAQYHWGLGTLPELQRAADLGETEPDLYVALGDAERQTGDLAAARAAYRRALGIDPFFTPASDRLGELG
jgi:O-antigen ligase